MHYIAHKLPTMTIEDIGITIRKRRDLKGLTQQELASMSGVHLRSINTLESGKGNPSLRTLLKIGLVLNLEVIVRVE
jgi:transcriptional regulator with XRE-family HTH domain